MRWAALAMAGLFACGGSSAAPAGGTGDGGSGSTGAPDGGTDAGPGDAGPGDAGAGYAADCAGLVPAAPGSALTFDAPAGSCVGGTSDGMGSIAVIGGQPQAWWVYDARGAHQGNFTSSMALPQPEGFIGMTAAGSGQSLAWYDQGGGPHPTMPLASGSVVAPGSGGGALVFGGGNAALFDANANFTSSVAVSGTLLGGAQDASGPVLALTSGISGVWVDFSKGSAGAPFSIGAGTNAFARALAGGGIAVRIDGHWAATLLPGDSSMRAAPAWLADGDDFQVVEGGKAYAVIHGAVISFFSAAGNSCGALTLRDQAAVDVGLDGTVIGSSGTGGCTKVFWPGLLK